MSKIIKDLSLTYNNEPVPNRLWDKVQGTIQSQQKQKTVSFFSVARIAVAAAVLICVIGLNTYQKHATHQLVNNYLYDEFIDIDFSEEESDWEIDTLLGTL
jgi:negative regulator of sigma E activity